ncbi:hypothetical protein NECAME_13696 [Necator americanus]|uniref:Uncharacterized protein n=1 Tax=Necator americanus TaxID=51031 RepID=W2STR4_NECAM|nr:hypothetical protein NECAME_13696 [Necator americanus]ETN72888.1 hypothetical protein NECAME_13696 [Necator americanus]
MIEKQQRVGKVSAEQFGSYAVFTQGLNRGDGCDADINATKLLHRSADDPNGINEEVLADAADASAQFSASGGDCICP